MILRFFQGIIHSNDHPCFGGLLEVVSAVIATAQRHGTVPEQHENFPSHPDSWYGAHEHIVALPSGDIIDEHDQWDFEREVARELGDI
jgi:hypothetical protein